MEKLPEKAMRVDDDRNLLDSFRRQLRKQLNLETATSKANNSTPIPIWGHGWYSTNPSQPKPEHYCLPRGR
jgi:hypothetical protein